MGVTVTDEATGRAAAKALPAGINANASMMMVKIERACVIRFILFSFLV